jgi:hypothetical protein
MLKSSWKFVALGLFAALSMSMTLAGDTRDLPAKSIRPDMGKIAESTTSVKMPEPNFGYEGHLGCFVATAQGKARGMIVVHQYPDTAKIALGNTKLTYEGTTQLNNVSGYVFKTDFDGKQYPSKVFLSSEKVYFGGGISGYIAADYRDNTGWAWKLTPLRRMDIVNGQTVGAGAVE